jgi:hypothetical protein
MSFTSYDVNYKSFAKDAPRDTTGNRVWGLSLVSVVTDSS